MTDPSNPELERLRTLADRLDCLIEEDFRLLTAAAESTPAKMRRTGDGPAYILAVNQVLYPRKAVAEWLQTKIRSRDHSAARSCL